MSIGYALFTVFHLYLCVVFYISLILLYNRHKQGYDHLTCAYFPLFGMARLPACSHERPPLHPGSIRVLNISYSLQHMSQALKLYLHTCLQHAHMPVGSIFFVFCFVNIRPCHAHGILLFHHPRQVQLVFSRGPSPLHPLYLLPSLLAPVGVWTDPPSLDQWTLPCVSDTGGHRI